MWVSHHCDTQVGQIWVSCRVWALMSHASIVSRDSKRERERELKGCAVVEMCRENATS